MRPRCGVCKRFRERSYCYFCLSVSSQLSVINWIATVLGRQREASLANTGGVLSHFCGCDRRANGHRHTQQNDLSQSHICGGCLQHVDPCDSVTRGKAARRPPSRGGHPCERGVRVCVKLFRNRSRCCALHSLEPTVIIRCTSHAHACMRMCMLLPLLPACLATTYSRRTQCAA